MSTGFEDKTQGLFLHPHFAWLCMPIPSFPQEVIQQLQNFPIRYISQSNKVFHITTSPFVLYRIFFFFNDFKSMETVSGRSTDTFIPSMTPLRNFITLRAINQHTGFPQLFSEQQKCFHSCGLEATQDASTCMLCVLGCSSRLLRLAVGLNFQRMVGWGDRLRTSSFHNFPFLQF